MITLYLRPNITVEYGLIGSRRFYIYNYKGVSYRVFDALIKLREFIESGINTWIFECESENKLDKYLRFLAQCSLRN
jgi:nitrogen regulatory protein PII-like uncharacterized protein